MTNDRRSTFRCARLAVAALALGIFSSAGIAGVSAQDASPEASPASVACVSPGLPPGTPTPMDDMAGMDMGSPEAMEEVASPAAPSRNQQPSAPRPTKPPPPLSLPSSRITPPATTKGKRPAIRGSMLRSSRRITWSRRATLPATTAPPKRLARRCRPRRSWAPTMFRHGTTGA